MTAVSSSACIYTVLHVRIGQACMTANSNSNVPARMRIRHARVRMHVHHASAPPGSRLWTNSPLLLPSMPAVHQEQVRPGASHSMRTTCKQQPRPAPATRPHAAPQQRPSMPACTACLPCPGPPHPCPQPRPIPTCSPDFAWREEMRKDADQENAFLKDRARASVWGHLRQGAVQLTAACGASLARLDANWDTRHLPAPKPCACRAATA